MDLQNGVITISSSMIKAILCYGAGGLLTFALYKMRSTILNAWMIIKPLSVCSWFCSLFKRESKPKEPRLPKIVDTFEIRQIASGLPKKWGEVVDLLLLVEPYNRAYLLHDLVVSSRPYPRITLSQMNSILQCICDDHCQSVKRKLISCGLVGPTHETSTSSVDPNYVPLPCVDKVDPNYVDRTLEKLEKRIHDEKLKKVKW